MKINWRLALAAVAVLVSPAMTGAADTAATGFYTAEEAQQGRTLYGANCASCHGDSLQGGAGPSLIGPNFLATWGSRTIGNLVAFEHSQMPLGKPGSVPEQDDFAITAFIFQRNRVAAGTTPLTPGSPLLSRQVGDAMGGQGSAPTAVSAAPAPQAAPTPVLTA
jgi:cytochrome c